MVTGKPDSYDQQKQAPRDIIIHGMLNFFSEPIVLTRILVEQMFTSTLDLQDSFLTISVGDLKMIQNIIVSDRAQV